MTLIEKLELSLLGIISFDSEELRAKYKEKIEQFNLLEKEQKMYSEEEVIKFAKWCANLKVYDNETYVNNTFETLIKQFKKK